MNKKRRWMNKRQYGLVLVLAVIVCLPGRVGQKQKMIFLTQPVQAQEMESNIDRPGMDYNDFDLSEARPELCQAACNNDFLNCNAYTYVKPGFQGPKARCFLKWGTPSPVQNQCCVSGFRNIFIACPVNSVCMEPGLDRPGMDYVDFDLSEAKPELCQAACNRDPNCQAYTYVKPRIQGPKAHCFLKFHVPSPVQNQGCVSGIKARPFTLLSYSFDANNILVNPKWGWQVTHSGEPPDPTKLCNDEPDNPLHQCTNQETSRDTASTCSGPHVNWFPGTYEGTIFWDKHSCNVCDDDYNFRLQRSDKAGYTVNDSEGLELEFDSDETIDHFNTPWWVAFHQAVDRNLGHPGGEPGRMVYGKFAIVTGLIGLDCEHHCGAEVHPVWAMAIRVKDDPSDEVWAIFVRNWGDEGWCSSEQHFLPLTSYIFQLPWRAGASSVSVAQGTQFLTNDNHAPRPTVTFTVNQGVRVDFGLSPPHKDGTLINGELHLQWSGAHVQPPPQPVSVAPTGAQPHEDKIENRLGALLAQMTPQQRETLRAKLPRKTISPDNIVLKPVQLTTVPHLAVSLLAHPVNPPRALEVPDAQKVEEDQRRNEAICAAFGANVPGFPNLCISAPSTPHE